MKATINDVVIADAPQDDLIKIEGNWYFPPASISPGVLEESPTPYVCPWKGECQYFNVKTDDGQVTSDAAWSYPKPYPASFDRVGQDYSNYVAFSPAVQVAD